MAYRIEKRTIDAPRPGGQRWIVTGKADGADMPTEFDREATACERELWAEIEQLRAANARMANALKGIAETAYGSRSDVEEAMRTLEGARDASANSPGFVTPHAKRYARDVSLCAALLKLTGLPVKWNLHWNGKRWSS